MEFTFDITRRNRKILSDFLETISLKDLNAIPEGFNNNIFWNIAHVVVTQQLLVYKLSGVQPLISDELIAAYRKGTKPDRDVDQQEVDEIKGLLFSTVEQTKNDYEKGLFQNYHPYTVSTGSTLNSAAEALNFNNFHEGIHLGSILALRRALNLV